MKIKTIIVLLSSLYGINQALAQGMPRLLQNAISPQPINMLPVNNISPIRPYAENYALSMSVMPSKESYAFREAVQFKLMTNKDAYVYIFNASNNQRNLLWPTMPETHYLVRAQTEITLPQYGLNLPQIPANLGYEKVLVVASSKKLDFSRDLTTAYNPIQSNANLADQQGFIQAYLNVANQPPELAQQEVTLQFSAQTPMTALNAPVTYTTTTVLPAQTTSMSTNAITTTGQHIVVNQDLMKNLPNTYANFAMKNNAQGATYFIASPRQNYAVKDMIELNYGSASNGTMHLVQINKDGRVVLLKSQYVAGRMLQDKVVVQKEMQQFAVWFAESAQHNISQKSQIPSNAAIISIQVSP